jgi:glycosyltransferase involved in cell wall biosynthesis
MKKKMKVLTFVYLNDTPVTHILEVFSKLQNSYETELIVLKTPDKSNVTDLTKKVKIREVPFTQYKIPFLRGLWYEIYIILYLLTSREKIDILYSRLRPFSISEYIIRILKKIPVIIEVNGLLTEEVIMEVQAPPFFNPILSGIVSFFEGKALSASNKIISVTPDIKNRLQEAYNISKDKIVVIENGANTQLFKPINKQKAKKTLNLEEKSPYITFIGNLAPWQGVEFLVQAAPHILDRFPEIKFLIVGDGPLKEELLKMIGDLNLLDHFIFTGMVPYEQVPLYVNSGELCIAYKKPLKSGYSALKVYEYMACGKPIVASRVSGFEILEQQNFGVLVEPENPDKLANAIIKLLKNDKLREEMGTNGRKYIVENNSWDAVTRKISEILEDLPDFRVKSVNIVTPPGIPSGKMKVLIISYYFNQEEEIGSIRIQGLAKNLANSGWEPTILTIKSKTNSNHQFKTIETDYEDLRENWKKVLNLNTEEPLKEQLDSTKNYIQRNIVDVILKIWSELFAYPDLQRNWYKPALEAGIQILENESFDAIISTSSPVTSHLIANKLKKGYNVPWIADLRDLWTQNHYYMHTKFRKILDSKLESNVLAEADALTTVSPTLVEKLKEKHKKANIFSIPNGFDPNKVNPGVPLTNKFSIIYTGRLYEGKRDPALLFKALKELSEEKKIKLNDFRVDFYGRIQNWLKKEIEKYQLNKIVKLHGTVPREIIIKKQWESQIQLLLTWKNPDETGVLTGKIFEYLAAKRPVLSYGVEKGSVKDLIEETNAGFHARNLEELKNIIEKLYKEYKSNGKVSYNGLENEINKYTHEEMSKKFLEVLKTVAND